MAQDTPWSAEPHHPAPQFNAMVSPRLGHTQQLPPVTLGATAHTQ